VLFEEGGIGDPSALLPIPAMPSGEMNMDDFYAHIGCGWEPAPDAVVHWQPLEGLSLKGWADVLAYFREAAQAFQTRARATADVVEALEELPGRMPACICKPIIEIEEVTR
jgi:hypothetical protein